MNDFMCHKLVLFFNASDFMSYNLKLEKSTTLSTNDFMCYKFEMIPDLSHVSAVHILST